MRIYIGTPFICPICAGWMENADSDCEAKIMSKVCYDTDPVCAMSVTPAKGYMVRATKRVCITRPYYNELKANCETSGDCSMSMCDTSGCKAEYPTSGE